MLKYMLSDTNEMLISVLRIKYCTGYHLFRSECNTDDDLNNNYVRFTISIVLVTIHMVTCIIFQSTNRDKHLNCE